MGGLSEPPLRAVQRGTSQGARQDLMLPPLTPCIHLGSSRIGLHCAHGPSTFWSCAVCEQEGRGGCSFCILTTAWPNRMLLPFPLTPSRGGL